MITGSEPGHSRKANFELVDDVKRQLEGATPSPDGYNSGINYGVAAVLLFSPESLHAQVVRQSL